jgi:hypothetical protein
MPRRTKTGQLQVNLTIPEDAYALLQQHARTSKSYGQFVGELLREHAQRQTRDALAERVERLEQRLTLTPAGVEE